MAAAAFESKPTRRIGLKRVWLQSIVLILFVARVFFPELRAFVWHSTHENPVLFQGWAVPVPDGWVADSSALLLMVFQEARIFSSREVGFIFLLAGPTDAPFEPFAREQWEEKASRDLSEEGYQILGTRSANVAGSKVYCVEGIIHANPSRVQVLCKHAHADLMPSFIGEHRDTEQFYSFISRIRRVSDN
jgi:hypothetical protein